MNYLNGEQAKIGDRIKIKSWSRMEKEFGPYIIDYLKKEFPCISGKKGTITAFDEDINGVKIVFENEKIDKLFNSSFISIYMLNKLNN